MKEEDGGTGKVKTMPILKMCNLLSTFAMPIPFDPTYHPIGRRRVWAVSPSAGTGPKGERQLFMIGK
jgi:hypothetical protein